MAPESVCWFSQHQSPAEEVRVDKNEDVSRSLLVLKGLEVEQPPWGAVLKWNQHGAQDSKGEEGEGHFLSLDGF